MYIWWRTCTCMEGQTLQLFTAVCFVHKACYIAYSCNNKFTNYDFQVFLKKFPKVVLTNELCCSSSSLDGGYTDAKMDEIEAEMGCRGRAV